MDKFGYIRGKRGPPGPRGKDAVELHTWCPDAVLRMFRETEQCTYYFNTAEDGISKDEGQFALKDRFGKRNAICMQNFRKPTKVSKVYGYIFTISFSIRQLQEKENECDFENLHVLLLRF